MSIASWALRNWVQRLRGDFEESPRSATRDTSEAVACRAMARRGSPSHRPRVTNCGGPRPTVVVANRLWCIILASLVG